MLVYTDGLPNRSSSDTDTIDMITKICHDVFPAYGSSTTGPLLDSWCCFIGFQSFVNQLSTFLNKVLFDRLFYAGAPATMSVRAREPALTPDLRTSFPRLTAVFRNI